MAELESSIHVVGGMRKAQSQCSEFGIAEVKVIRPVERGEEVWTVKPLTPISSDKSQLTLRLPREVNNKAQNPN